MLPMDFFSRSDDMSQTRLPVGSDTVIGGIAISYKGAGKVFSEDGLRHLGGAVTVDVKESEVFIACKPHVVADAIVSPRGLIGMGNRGCPELFTQVLVNPLPHSDCFLIKANQGGRNGG